MSLLILLAALALLCLWLGLRLYALERDIRTCARQLRAGRPRVSMAAPNAAAEELLTAVNALLARVDLLIDGPFVLGQRNLELRFRGSENQRLIDMRKTREQGHVVLVEE